MWLAAHSPPVLTLYPRRFCCETDENPEPSGPFRSGSSTTASCAGGAGRFRLHSLSVPSASIVLRCFSSAVDAAAIEFTCPPQVWTGRPAGASDVRTALSSSQMNSDPSAEKCRLLRSRKPKLGPRVVSGSSSEPLIAPVDGSTKYQSTRLPAVGRCATAIRDSSGLNLSG